MESILAPWPWYIGGPLIALIMLGLLYVGKSFGISSNFRTICTMCGAGNTCDFFCFDWKSQTWNLWVLLGAVVGGYIASQYLGGNQIPEIDHNTVIILRKYGFESAGQTYAPTELYGNRVFSDVKTVLLLLAGGVLVGFGSRYAGGCTSGHAISGLSNLQLPSLVATIGFFIGGLLMVHLIFPFLFN